MAIHKGSEGLVKVGSSNTVAEVRSYSIDETADTIESTSMGDSAKTFESSLTSFSGSVECFWDETDTAQVAMSIGSTITLNLYPEGADSGDTYYSGSAIVTGKTVSGAHDGLVEASISFQGSGALTITTV